MKINVDLFKNSQDEIKAHLCNFPFEKVGFCVNEKEMLAKLKSVWVSNGIRNTTLETWNKKYNLLVGKINVYEYLKVIRKTSSPVDAQKRRSFTQKRKINQILTETDPKPKRQRTCKKHGKHKEYLEEFDNSLGELHDQPYTKEKMQEFESFLQNLENFWCTTCRRCQPLSIPVDKRKQKLEFSGCQQV